MATSRPKSGVNEYSITTGPGPLTLTGPVPGFRGFVSADDGLVYPYGIYQEGIAFETGTGTYTHASRQLSRTNVLGNINGTTVPLTLGAGTKEVSVVIPGERVVMTDVENEYSADQFYNGFAINLDADHDSWLDVVTDDVFKLYLNSSQVLNITSGNSIVTVSANDSTATEGPLLVLGRTTASPANNDAIGCIYIMGQVTGGATQLAAKIRTYWTSVTAGSFSALTEFQVANLGAPQTILTLRPNVVSVPSGVALLTAGKTSTSTTTIGAEMLVGGAVQAVTNSQVPILACLNGTDGPLVSFYKNGTNINSISIASGDIQYNGFTGAHWSEWAPGQGGVEFETFGTVVSTAEGTLPSPGRTPLPMVRPACGPDDRRVFGVMSGRELTKIGSLEGPLLSIHAIGDSMIRVRGEVAGGDFLWASTTPGVAEAVPSSTQIRADILACIIAKATQDSTDDGGERLVSCVLMAG